MRISNTFKKSKIVIIALTAVQITRADKIKLIVDIVGVRRNLERIMRGQFNVD